MPAGLTATLLDLDAQGWADDVDRLRALLGAPHNPTLFPPHFLKVTLPRIGGRIVQFQLADAVVAVGFLFPRLLSGGRRSFTLRFHQTDQALEVDREQVQRCSQEALGAGHVELYDPAARHSFEATSEPVDGFELGHPSAADAQAIRALQSQVWGSPADYLYPIDIHARDFGPTTSLVVRAANEVVGYLFGFAKFGGEPLPEQWTGRVNSSLRIESQQMAVLPAWRGRGLATTLKARQAELARQAGVDVINWTADPLQWPNAMLNLGRLRAVAFDFFPAMYQFRNELNRVTPSRLVLTWLVNSQRVAASVRPAAAAGVLDLSGRPDIRPVNAGPDGVILDANDPTIAVEIPANWTTLQASALDEALRWREVTDTILRRYVGLRPDQYAVTGVAQDGPRRYLVAQRMTSSLLESLVE